MARKDTFDKMHKLYNAIKDIDRIIESPNEKNVNGDCKLDQILLYVKDIPREEYDKVYIDSIISNIRAAIVDIYNKTAKEINDDIIAENPVINPTSSLIFNNTRMKSNAERGIVYAGQRKTD